MAQSLGLLKSAHHFKFPLWDLILEDWVIYQIDSREIFQIILKNPFPNMLTIPANILRTEMAYTVLLILKKVNTRFLD
mgnify:CR=1 FL=1